MHSRQKFRYKCILEKNGFHKIFGNSSHIEKLFRNVQLTILRKRMHVVSDFFSSMLKYGRKILILNIVIPPLQFQKNSQKLYKTTNPP